MIYVDMDGVLVDFDQHYQNKFGVRSSTGLDNVDWKLVDDANDFYYTAPPMVDMRELWEHIAPATVLTGVPYSVNGAANQKRAWVRRHLGQDVQVITVLSKDKWKYCKPGDVLIDDWDKYKHLWEQAGGIWITHTTAVSTIEKIKTLYADAFANARNND